MKVFLGEKGLNETWQDKFPKTMKCHKCGGNCRIMFVGIENEGKEFICNIHENMKDDKFWLHDACAVAVYLCEKCFEPNALVNQA